MKNLVKNETFSLDYEEEERLFIQKWHGNLDETQYKENMFLLLAMIEKHAPIPYSIVYPNINFLITTELQTWTAENVFVPAVNFGLQRAAFVLPKPVYDSLVIEVLALEQTLDEAQKETQREHKEAFKTQYFYDKEQALDWLFES